jgi:hypothetical protein
MFTSKLFTSKFVLAIVPFCILLVSTATNQARGALVLTSNYEFNNNFQDTLGSGPNLVAFGAGAFNAGSYSFGPQQGLQLVSPFTSGDYRIEFDATFTNLTAWDKLIDFKNLTSDNGLYFSSNAANNLNFIDNFTNSPDSFSENVQYTIGLERVGGLVTVTANGVTEFTFNDTVTQRAIASAANTVSFFIDDTEVIGDDVTGSVSAIRIFTVSAVPEPSTVLLMSTAGVLFGFSARRAKRKANKTQFLARAI